MKKKFPLYIFILSIVLLNIYLILNNIDTKKKQDQFFRLHVVANSNSIDDQIIKLNVVKKINNYLNSIYEFSDYSYNDLNKKDNAKEKITDNINCILEVANNELQNQDAKYTCYANIGKISYDKKYSSKINMDKGIYDSIQIVLGNGNGENFWSLIFPHSYNKNSNITTNNQLQNNNIQIKSGIIEGIKKVVKSINF